jgi:glycine cleavage system H protein
MSNVMSDLLYTKEHEWVLVEDNVVTVGITDYAQHELGDITFVELPDDDQDVHAGDEIANIESVKAATPVYSPLSGRVVEVNANLEETPESVNQDPYGDGWIFRIETKGEAELDALLNAESYESYLEDLQEEGE